jgi:hypothetical protein
VQDIADFLIDNFINKEFILQDKQEPRFLAENGVLQGMG